MIVLLQYYQQIFFGGVLECITYIGPIVTGFTNFASVFKTIYVEHCEVTDPDNEVTRTIFENG